MDIPVLKVWDEEKQCYVGVPAMKGDTPVKGVDYFTPEDIQNFSRMILENIYPIGSIYISVSSTNPSITFGFGTWEQIKDRFLLSSGDTYKAGSTGGESSHTLTVDEMPAHSHKFAYTGGGTAQSVSKIGLPESSVVASTKTWRPTNGDLILNTGSGQAHNNMPPYLVVYVWKRIK